MPAHGLRPRRQREVHLADGHEETYEAGDAYYAPPGHTTTLYAGSQVVEFSPTAELQQTMAVVEKYMATAGS